MQNNYVLLHVMRLALSTKPTMCVAVSVVRKGTSAVSQLPAKFAPNSKTEN